MITMKSKLILPVLFFLFPFILLAQSDQLYLFNEQRLNTNKKAMTILGSWAIGNIAVGALLMGRRDGTDKYFHQMNLGWGAVNLGIAGFSWYTAMKSDPGSYDLTQSIQEHHSIKQILLLNTGLDVAYMLGGAYLIERSKNKPDKADRLRGFGRSIVMQGAFLFVFDIGFFIFHNKNGKLLRQILDGLEVKGNGIGLNFQF